MPRERRLDGPGSIRPGDDGRAPGDGRRPPPAPVPLPVPVELGERRPSHLLGGAVPHVLPVQPVRCHPRHRPLGPRRQRRPGPLDGLAHRNVPGYALRQGGRPIGQRLHQRRRGPDGDLHRQQRSDAEPCQGAVRDARHEHGRDAHVAEAPRPRHPRAALSGHARAPRRPDLEGRRHLVPAGGRRLRGQRRRGAAQLQGPAGVELRGPHIHGRRRQARRLLGASVPAALRPQGRDDHRHPPRALLRRQLRQGEARVHPGEGGGSSTTAPRSTTRPTPTWWTTRERAAASGAS